MEAKDKEKISQLISRTDMNGNEKVIWLIIFIDEQLKTNTIEPIISITHYRQIILGMLISELNINFDDLVALKKLQKLSQEIIRVGLDYNLINK
jgi:hypothetical protein